MDFFIENRMYHRFKQVFIQELFDGKRCIKEIGAPARFESCIFEFKGLPFECGTFSGQRFENCKFVGCTFDQVHFFEGVFINCKFIDCTFIDSSSLASVYSKCIFHNCKFQRELRVADYVGCEMSDVTYWKCSLSKLIFDNCTVERMNAIASVETPLNRLKMAFNDCTIEDGLFEGIGIAIDNEFKEGTFTCGNL